MAVLKKQKTIQTRNNKNYYYNPEAYVSGFFLSINKELYNMKIKNIIFDLGGVFLPLNMQATLDAFTKLGAKDFNSIYTIKSQEKFFDLFDKGLIQPDEFRIELKKHLDNKTTFEQIDNAWNAMLNLIPQSKIDFITAVKNNYTIYLLSNTNAIHVAKFEADHLQYYGYDILKTLFIKTYYSNNTGMRKPDKEIFEMVLAENNLEADETVFFDDSMQHVEGALKAGVSAYHLDLKKDSIETLFHRVMATLFENKIP